MSLMSTSYTRRFLLTASLALSLIGCSQNGPVEAPDSPVAPATPDARYALTVALSPSDTPESVAAAYGGEVLVWEGGDFAVVGVDEEVEGAEINRDAFLSGGERAQMNGRSSAWAGGRSSAWAGGRSSAWAGGRSSAWAGGTFTWMPENTRLWQQVRLEEGQALTENLGYGVKVAVIDTGVDLLHPALVEALAPEEEWRDFYGDDALPQEEGVLGEGGYGHGTNVAGIVRQVAPRATILPIRVLGPDGSGNLTDVASAIHWAQKRGADIINLSLGSDEEVKAVEKVIDTVTKKGVLVVASTGNTGDSAVTYPARSALSAKRAENRLSVTSVNSADVKSGFATYRAEVELAAPGENVFSPAPDERVAAWSGTSMAAPMASGALALALGETLALPRDEVADALKTHSFNLYANDLNAPYAGQLGEGRLDLAAFLRAVVQPVEEPAEEPQARPCEGGVTRLTLRYLGSDEDDIRVVQEDGGTVLFEDEVDPGETFSFDGAAQRGTMGKKIKFYVDGDRRGDLYTNCKKPIGPGLIEEVFEVVSGESLAGPLELISNQ